METKKSFYDFDYIIELSEKRVEQYINAYQVILARLTNIILIYSILGIYLVPIILDVPQLDSLPFRLLTGCFMGLLVVSIIYTIRLLIPVDITYFQMSSIYYQDLRIQYEDRMLRAEMTEREKASTRETINKYLKASYIDELIRSQSHNAGVVRRKGSFYFRALIWSLIAIVPYIICVGFHVTRKIDVIQKVELISPK